MHKHQPPQDRLKKPQRPFIHTTLAGIEGIVAREDTSAGATPRIHSTEPISQIAPMARGHIQKTVFAPLLQEIDKAIAGKKDPPVMTIGEVANLVAKETSGWKEVVERMVDLLGADNLGPKGKAGWQFFYQLDGYAKPTPVVLDHVRGRLTGLEDSDSHPFRGIDAKKILSFMQPGIGLELAELDATVEDRGVWRRHNAIESITGKTVEMINRGERTEAKGVITYVTPMLLKIISEDFGSMFTAHEMRFDKAAAMEFFREIGLQMPEDVVTEVINQATEIRKGGGEAHPELGQAGIFVLARVLTKNNPHTLKVLSQKTIFEGLPNYVAVSGLVNAGEDAIKPVLDQSMKTENTTELGMLGITLANIGVKAIYPIIDYFDRDDSKMTMRCIALLSPFAYLAMEKTKKTDNPEEEKAGIIEKLHESTRLARILLNAKSSGDPWLITQANMFETLMRRPEE